MAKQLFKVNGGYSDGKVHYLSGSGLPGGDSSYQDNAPVGSWYSDTDTGYSYKKHTAGAGAGNWIRMLDQNDLSALTSTRSWREPVDIADTSTDQATVLADMNDDDTIQGVTVQAGQRFLLMGQTTPSDRNVFIVGGSSGAWTLTEDDNGESAGDTVKVLYGDHASKEFTFDGTNWVWTNTDSDAEDIAIRAFIGKSSAGSELPTYTSTNFVANNDSLSTAIGKLDTQVKTNSDAITTLQTSTGNLQAELDATQAALGAAINASGTYVPHTGTSFLDGNTSLTEDLLDLDTVLGALNTNYSNTATEVDALETSLGSMVNSSGGWVGFSTTNYLNTATDTTNALSLLDTQVKANADLIASLNVAGTIETADVDFATNVANVGSFTNGANIYGNAVTTGQTILVVDSATKAAAIFTVQASGAPTETTAGPDGNKIFNVKYSSSATFLSGTYFKSSASPAAVLVGNTDSSELDYYGDGAYKSVKAKLQEIGSLPALNTTDKTSLVSAINELKADIGTNNLEASQATFASTAANISSFTNGSTINGQVINTGDTILVVDGANAGAVYTVQASGAPVLTTSPASGTKFFEVTKSSYTGTLSGTYVSFDNAGTIQVVKVGSGDASDLDYYGEGTAKSVQAKLDEIGTLASLATTDKTSIVNAINEVKSALGSTIYSSTTTGIASPTVVDSLPTDSVEAAKWELVIKDETTETKRVATEVFATHNRTSTADATQTDYTEYAKLKLGSKINGLNIYTQLSGVGASQKMELVVDAPSAVTVKLTRLIV